MTAAFPLQWPQHRPRTETRRRAAFNKKVSTGRGYAETKELTVADALGRLQDEIDRLGASEYVLSSNLATRLDGLPRSGQSEPGDPGAALYFQLAGKPHCLPCDTYDRVADNIAAIAKHIEATRAIERYGVANLAEMFAGFTALPAPGAKRHWSEVLGSIPPRFGWKGIGPAHSREQIEAAFRERAKFAHPDRGGTNEAMAELNRAREEALREIGEGQRP